MSLVIPSRRTLLAGFLLALPAFSSLGYNPIVAEAIEQPGTALPALNQSQQNLPSARSMQSIQSAQTVQAASTSTGFSDPSGIVMTELALSRVGVTEEITAETTELFGEQIDTNTGAISMSHTDVSVDGNFPIGVGVTRVYRGAQYSEGQLLHFADWQLDIPAITTSLIGDGTPLNNTWVNGKACSGPLNPGSVNIYDYGYVVAKQYWSGDFISVPGVGNERLLAPATTTAGVSRVAKNWKISCFTEGNAEGFKATSPQGVTYTFSKLRLVPANNLEMSVNDLETGSTWTILAGRFNAFMQVTKIEDRFGNTVTYNYSSPDQLDSISSSDGRTVSFSYELGSVRKRVKSITVNNQTWQYFYRTSSTPQWVNNVYTYVDKLHRVVQPDGREWVYDIDFTPVENIKSKHTIYSHGDSQQDEKQCTFSAGNTPYTPPVYTSTVTHPNGLVATFELTPTIFGRTGVPRKTVSQTNRTYEYDRCFSNFAVTRKTLSGKGVPSLIWNYSYSQNPGKFADGDTTGDLGPAPAALTGLAVTPAGMNTMDLRSTTVVAPDGSKTIHVFDRRYSATQDKEVATFQYDTDGTTLLQRAEHKYVAGTAVGVANMYSHSFNGRSLNTTLTSFENEAQHNNYINKLETKVYRYVGGIVADTYTTTLSDYNIYGQPELSVESNSLNTAKRYTKSTFLHDTTHWLLNLPRTKQLSADGSSYTTVSETTYHNASSSYKSLPYQSYSYGQLVSTNTSYHSDGNLKLQDFNLSNRWIQFDNYKAGKPQLIKVPQRYAATCTTPDTCALSLSMTVNDNGTIATVTDFNGYSTSYSYDAMRRLTGIDPADPFWADTAISYETDHSGIGALQQVLSRGNYRKTVTLDGLMRPILQQEGDATDGSTTRYSVKAFNAYGKEIFASVPSTSSTESYGSFTSYDGLQRIKTMTNTPQGDLSYSYLAGNKIAVSNGRGYSTTTSYLAYGSPEHELPTAITQPESATTTLAYNLFGSLVSVAQGGITENRVYNTQQRMCLQKRPDTGVSVYQYNTLGQMTAYAEGLSGTGANCTAYTDVGAAWITQGYDNVGALRSKSYADGSPSQSYVLDNQGNLLKLSSGSGSTAAVWDYSYNSKQLIESETLTIDNQSWILDQAYDSLGSLSSVVYPSGDVVSYAPNALGQATQAGGYATAASYHPNGQLKSFTYGNGLAFTQSVDSEYRPYERQVKAGGTLRVGQRYSYDANDNLNAITDLVNSSKNISLGFDGLDRLTSAAGYWGSGSMSYDSIGNIKTKTLGSQALSYSYNSSTNRLNTVTGGYSFSYDGRGTVLHNGKRGFSVNRANQMTGSDSVSYSYDGYNRRVKKVNGGTTQYSFYSQSGQFLSTTGTNGPTEYVYLGSQLVAQVSQVATADDKPGYTGHLEDKDIGLTYMQQRYYDPVIGRFYSNDPVGFSADNPMMFNRYAYANNNPYKYVDPDGKMPMTQQQLSALSYSAQAQSQMQRAAPMMHIAAVQARTQQIQALGPVDPAGVALGTIGVLASTGVAATGIGMAPGSVGLLLSMDGIRSAWTGNQTLTGMAFTKIAKARGLNKDQVEMAGEVGDFAQGTLSGGGKAVINTVKGVGDAGDAAGAISQLSDTADFGGQVKTYNDVGRIRSEQLSKELDQ